MLNSCLCNGFVFYVLIIVRLLLLKPLVCFASGCIAAGRCADRCLTAVRLRGDASVPAAAAHWLHGLRVAIGRTSPRPLAEVSRWPAVTP